MNFLESLKNVDFVWLLACALNGAMILAISHWGPWTWALGHKMKRYFSYWTGILSVIWAWFLWSYWYGSLNNWMALWVCNLLLHWPLWVFARGWMRRWSRPVSYGWASLPVLAGYVGWCAWRGDLLSPVLLFVIYAVGGLCTLGYYKYDQVIGHKWNNEN